MLRKSQTFVAITFAVSMLPGICNAGLINGGTLIGQSDANQLEAWLGSGDLDFTNIWSGIAGVATAASFHGAVDGAGPTVSVYSIAGPGLNGSVRVGGYTASDWAGAGVYKSDATAFLFNLDSLEYQAVGANPYNLSTGTVQAIYASPEYFATFGGGHDLFGGFGTLGTCFGSALNNDSGGCSGYSLSFSYDTTQGQIVRAGDSGSFAGSSGYGYVQWHVVSLEVFTFSPAAATGVPEPATLALIALGVAGVGCTRRRKA